MRLIILLLLSINCFGQLDFNKPSTAFKSGYGKLTSFMALNPFYTYTTVKVGSNFFFGAAGRSSYRMDPFVHRFNYATNEIDQQQRIVVSTVDTYDAHHMSTFTDGGDGNVLMVSEEAYPTDGGHAWTLKVHKTTTPGDITTLTNITNLAGRWSYPLIYNNGTKVFVSARGTTSTTDFIRGQYWYTTSSDGGTTFGTWYKLYDSGDEQLVAYFQRMHDFSDGYTYMALNERSNNDFNYTYVAVVRTSDFITWENMDGSFSKDVVNVGAITRAEMRANCMVYDSPSPTTIAVNFEGGCVKSNGKITLLISVQTLTANDFQASGIREVILDELRFYTFQTNAWIYNNVSIPSGMKYYWAADKPLMLLNNDQIADDILFIDHTDNRNVYIKRSVDNFVTTKTIKKLINPGTKWRLGSIAYNVPRTSDNVLVLADPKGNVFSGYFDPNGGLATDYTNIRVFKLNKQQ